MYFLKIHQKIRVRPDAGDKNKIRKDRGIQLPNKAEWKSYASKCVDLTNEQTEEPAADLCCKGTEPALNTVRRNHQKKDFYILRYIKNVEKYNLIFVLYLVQTNGIQYNKRSDRGNL